jgi:hypothetical protein
MTEGDGEAPTGWGRAGGRWAGMPEVADALRAALRRTFPEVKAWRQA